MPLLALLASLVSFAAQAADRKLGAVQDILEQRLKACAVCHGERGEGLTKAEFYPRLAGKPAGYLLNQLVAFRDGKRASPIMSYLVAYLSDDYLREIAEYYERLKPPYPPPVPAPAQLVSRGEALATKGDPSRDLPACSGCHGRSLSGLRPSIPGLVGLSTHYIASQMGAWRIGLRRAYEPDCMCEIASILTPEDVAAIAAWLGSLPASVDASAARRHHPLRRRGDPGVRAVPGLSRRPGLRAGELSPVRWLHGRREFRGRAPSRGCRAEPLESPRPA